MSLFVPLLDGTASIALYIYIYIHGFLRAVADAGLRCLWKETGLTFRFSSPRHV